MTKFITQYSLCPISNAYDFCGVCADKIEDTVITTVSKNIILIDINTQRQLKSWSTLEKLSSKVVYDKHSDKYIGIFGNNILRCWSYSSTSINKTNRYQKYIADLINDVEEVYVLFYDGSCQSLREALDSHKNTNDTTQANQMELLSKYSLLNGKIFNLPNGEKIMTYFQLYKQTYKYNFVRMKLNGERQVQRCPLIREDKNYDIIGATVIEGDGIPVLLTIWSDRRIFTAILDNNYLSNLPGDYVANLPFLDIEKAISIASLEGHFVAIYGANDNLEDGASLLLYNTQYKVTKAIQRYEQYYHYMQMWSVPNYIVLAMGQQLSVVKYRILKEILSELLGTQIGMINPDDLLIRQVTEEEHLEENMQFSKMKCGIMPYVKKSPKTKPPTKANDDELKPLITVDEFDNELKETCLTAMQVDIMQTDDPLDAAQVTLINNINGDHFICPNIQMLATTLEKSGSSQEETSAKLLDILLKSRQLADINTCLKRYNNIPERMLSRTLSFILSHRDTAGTLVNDRSGDFVENEILNTILSCTFDNDLIIAYIRRDIDYEQSLFLLFYLYNLLANSNNYDTEGDRQNFNCNYSSVQYELQIMSWFGVLIDANFQKLVLNADLILIELISKWNELLIDYKSEFIQLQELCALLYQVVEMKSIVKPIEDLQCYSIEEICLF